MKDEFVDYYACLGIEKNATEPEIKAAFRHLAKSCHPDHHDGSSAKEEEFKRINTAYAVLSKSSSRADYDLSYTRRESSRAAKMHEELVQMRRHMQVHARKSQAAMDRRERRQHRDPNRPVRRRPLLMRPDARPPRLFIWLYLAFWLWVLFAIGYTFCMKMF
ncbi:MAG: J domain-containing protein [Akkermansia sp.]